MVTRLWAVAVVLLAGAALVTPLTAWPWAALGLVGAICAVFGVRSTRVPGAQGGLAVAAVAGFGLAFSGSVWFNYLADGSDPSAVIAGYLFNLVMVSSGIVALALSFGRERPAPPTRHHFDGQ